VLIALLLILQDPQTFHDKRLGVRLSVPRGFELRTSGFKLNWFGTLCEIASADGRVSGVLYHSTAGWNVGSFAAWREKSLRDAPGTVSLRVTRDEALRRGPGDWRVRELRMGFSRTDFHYLDLYVAKGRHNIELVLWTSEAEWEDCRDAMGKIHSFLEVKDAWACPKCAEPIADLFECARCGKFDPPSADRWRALGIQVVTDASKIYPVRCKNGSVIGGGPTSSRRTPEYVERALRELSKYPDGLVKKLGIERLVFASEVILNGNPVGAVTDHETATIHLPVVEREVIPLFFEETMHHELFHVLDLRDDGKATEDPAWEKLNPTGFQYDPKAKASGRFEDDLQGFLNTYSMTGVGEDKAEVFGQLMIRAKAVQARTSKDAVLGRKVARIRELARAYHGKLDEAFWKSVER
jgi:hypothetical protein